MLILKPRSYHRIVGWRPLSLSIFQLNLYLLTTFVAGGQTVSSDLPKPINKTQQYLFYQHAGVVTEGGNNAINRAVPEWGPYEYSAILDSLRKRGFQAISEIRKKGVADSVYVEKIA